METRRLVMWTFQKAIDAVPYGAYRVLTGRSNPVRTRPPRWKWGILTVNRPSGADDA